MWEAVILMRKLATMCVVVFLSGGNDNNAAHKQLLLLVGIFFASCVGQVAFRPFAYTSLHRLELASILGNFFTAYCGLVFTDRPRPKVVLVTIVFLLGYVLWLAAYFVLLLAREFYLTKLSQGGVVHNEDGKARCLLAC